MGYSAADAVADEASARWCPVHAAEAMRAIGGASQAVQIYEKVFVCVATADFGASDRGGSCGGVPWLHRWCQSLSCGRASARCHWCQHSGPGNHRNGRTEAEAARGAAK